MSSLPSDRDASVHIIASRLRSKAKQSKRDRRASDPLDRGICEDLANYVCDLIAEVATHASCMPLEHASQIPNAIYESVVRLDQKGR